MTVYIYDENNIFVRPLLKELVEEGMRYTEIPPMSDGSTGSMALKPKFDEVNQVWIEGATQQEIDDWNEANKPQPSEPNQMEVLEKQLKQQEEAIGLIATQVAKNTLLQNGGIR